MLSTEFGGGRPERMSRHHSERLNGSMVLDDPRLRQHVAGRLPADVRVVTPDLGSCGLTGAEQAVCDA